jgi:hypothetical protein
MGSTNLQAAEVYCQGHGGASSRATDEILCPLPHAIARCPVCSLSWIGPGPDDSVVLCILTRHIVEIHPHTRHVPRLRSNAAYLSESNEPDDWCQHEPQQHYAVMARSRPRESTT